MNAAVEVAQADVEIQIVAVGTGSPGTVHAGKEFAAGIQAQGEIDPGGNGDGDVGNARLGKVQTTVQPVGAENGMVGGSSFRPLDLHTGLKNGEAQGAAGIHGSGCNDVKTVVS